MAKLQLSHPQNLPGPLFTDLTCIDCGTCYHIGPELFHENTDDKSIVTKQPASEDEWQDAKRAILSCPTNSIGVHNAPDIFKELPAGLPLHISENVYYLGYTSRDSFGATSYFIKGPNILIDSPKFHPWLVKALEDMGGVKQMFLSHQDDVADHEKFHEHFGCERIIHKDDLTSDTMGCEKILEGSGPWDISSEIKIISTPGHSKGHLNLIYQDKYLFTGDHIFVEEGGLRASKGVCWYSWSEQTKSVEKLQQEKFEWVLPGHGGWGFFGVETQSKLKELIASMKGRP
jgi:glyoxylase-like metal-dependent hydrolase (beta-lactamase superfamily II)/ferredoxin